MLVSSWILRTLGCHPKGSSSKKRPAPAKIIRIQGAFGEIVDEIRLIPVDGQLGVYLVGNLAAILDLCAKKSPGSLETGVQITLVAGAGFEPATFRL